MGAEEVWCLLFCWSLSAATEPVPVSAAQGRWRPVDVVLDCFLVKEGRQQGALGGNRNTVKALLVLKQVPVLDEGGLEGFTDFQGQVSAEDEPPVTFEASVEFQVTTQTPSLTSLLKSAVTLHCSFSTASSEALTRVEWRLQHQGSGRLVSSWTVGQGQAGQKGASLEPQQLQTAGNASLTLASLTVKDEGAYICQITTSRYQAQQIVQLSVQALPKVKLSQASEALPSSLTCHVTGFYPLDMAVTWSRQEVGGAPTPVSDASFSSLRQNAAGTYSISSFLVAEPGSEGATYTCHVTHISLQEPLVASTQVAPPEQRTGFGILVASGLFLITLWLLVLQRQHATLPRSA
ncbi:tapasin-related protein isoform X3 [Erinaceus europaeus]|uniref:Tapasin-related protein n=1 Tax=Erinaceus europaeus TaxID=9365 RepID=A0A1S3WHF9_ERIEU|nr:tapasin-related protein isoform X3 [Erinaceus europaeus]